MQKKLARKDMYNYKYASEYLLIVKGSFKTIPELTTYNLGA